MITAIVLAAGQSSRLGRPKQLLEYKGKPLIRHVVEKIIESKVEEVLVVVGAKAPEVAQVLEGLKAKIVLNEAYAEGQSSSVKAGVKAIESVVLKGEPIPKGFLFALGDQPLLRTETINLLIDEFNSSGGIVVPYFHGQRGNPVIFENTFLKELLTLEGDRGARKIISDNPGEVKRVEVTDKGVIFDVDTREEYERLNKPLIIIKGAGDLATGVAHRLFKSGFSILMLEIPKPTVIRRTVAFAECIYEGNCDVEGVTAILARDIKEVEAIIDEEKVAVLVDPRWEAIKKLKPLAVIDAIIAKKNLGTSIQNAPITIALGPGFTAGLDVKAVVETERGHYLGKVIYQGSAAPNTGLPGEIGGYSLERLLRAPVAGTFQGIKGIGSFVSKGEVVAKVGATNLHAPISGVLRGLLRSGLEVSQGFKVGDIDPRAIKEHCYTISDKARSVAGGVLEAVLFFKTKGADYGK